MATESGFITMEDLKRLAEEIGLEGKKKTKFLTQGWKVIIENEVRKLKLAAEAEKRKLAAETEKRKLAAEAKERKLAAEAEKWKLAAEAEEKKLATEAKERKLASEAAEQEAKRKHKPEMEKLRLECERLNGQRSASLEDQQATLSQASQNAVAKTKAPVFPGFVDGKDNMDSYLLRFERYTTVAGWERSDWATRLSPLLSGRALDVYSGLSDEQARDYDKLQKALLQRYDFTEQGYCKRFRGAKPEGQESPSQFIVRISNYLDKWVELAGGNKTFKGVSELMVREQFTNSCPKDVSVFLKERSPKDLEELAKLAELYLNAHGKKLSTKAPVTKQDVKTSLPRTHKDAMTTCVMAMAIELAKHQRQGMSRLVMAAGLIALNVGQWDMKLMSAKQHYSALYLNLQRGGAWSRGKSVPSSTSCMRDASATEK